MGNGVVEAKFRAYAKRSKMLLKKIDNKKYLFYRMSNKIKGKPSNQYILMSPWSLVKNFVSIPIIDIDSSKIVKLLLV